MASHETNEATTIQDLLKILPKHEQTLQVRMQDSKNRPNRNSNNNSNSSNPLYHTLRYDFKPASINSDEPAKLEYTKDGQVTIKAPNVGGSICTFRGQRRPHVKECLLIVDNKTGEVILQKLTDNITVKATRSLGGGAGGSSQGGGVALVNGNGGGSSNGIATTNNSGSGSSSGGANNTSVTNGVGPSPSSSLNTNHNHTNNHHNNNNTNSTSDIGLAASIAKNDGPQLSEESSDSSDSSSDSDSSSASSSSSSNNSSPNHDGFTF